MSLNERCKDRLYNYKFRQAVEHLDDDATRDERDLIKALGAMLGDPGWFDGDMATVAQAALRSVDAGFE